MLSDLTRRIEQAEAVSFDVFDTLFVRPLADPEDLFAILGQKFDFDEFTRLRREAQARAFRRMQQEGRREISLDDIYACFASGAIPASTLRDAEYELELALTVPNPRLVDVFAHAIERKPVVITSDMYLPRSFFDELMARHGLKPSAMFISSEQNATKRDTGELFDIVAHSLKLAPHQILHIGDNPVSDVERARQKGLSAWHYVDAFEANKSQTAVPPAASIGKSLVRAVSEAPARGSFAELGFRYGGPAAVGFLDWIATQARRDEIDHVLFLSRDGFVLERLARNLTDQRLPPFSYFKGSRVAFSLASTDETNFDAQLGFLLSGSHGLRPIELVERLGVTPPAPDVMEDLGLGDDVVVGEDNIARVSDLLSGYRAEILQVCRRNRRGLLNYLLQAGVKPGMRIAMIDVGWNGTTQDAFDAVLKKLMPVELFGYYLCLNDSEDCRRRQQRLHMRSLLSASSIGSERVAKIYAKRVAVELFFSAPHNAVIGYRVRPDGSVEVVEDAGRIALDAHARISTEITQGIEQFSAAFRDVCHSISMTPQPLDTVLPILDFVETIGVDAQSLLSSVENFDAWASSRNQRIALSAYLN